MLGDDLRAWFELFDGIVIYRPAPEGRHVADGWINWKDIERRFVSGGLLFGGRRYNPDDHVQREQVMDHIVRYASVFVTCRLLERRRQISPPSLDYRLTALGRRVGKWGYGARPGLRKRLLFIVLALGLKLRRYRWVITFGAAGWGTLNAIRFYSAATSWLDGLPFMAWSAAGIAVLVVAWVAVKNRVSD